MGAAGSDKGWQRRQGRRPAFSASAARRKKRTLRRSGRREGQDGRQKTPVVTTPKKKRPSKSRSRAMMAFQHLVSESILSACAHLYFPTIRVLRPNSGGTTSKGVVSHEVPYPLRE